MRKRESRFPRPQSPPLKVVEYLAVGLPVFANGNIGDCEEMLESHRLGVVVRTFSDDTYEKAIRKLLERLYDNDISSRCVKFVEHELSLANVGGPRYEGVYEKLLGTCAQTHAQQAYNNVA